MWKQLNALALSTVCAASVAVMAGSDAEAAICGTRDQIQKILSDPYQESSRGFGLVSDQGVVELYISQAGTWSILMTTAAGATCIIAAGHTWQDFAAQADGPSA
jgi:hypothetical protein